MNLADMLHKELMSSTMKNILFYVKNTHTFFKIIITDDVIKVELDSVYYVRGVTSTVSGTQRFQSAK